MTTLDELTRMLEAGPPARPPSTLTAATRGRRPTKRAARPSIASAATHGDLSQVWVVIDRPPATAEAIAEDCRRRAAFYSRSAFWRGQATQPAPAAKQQLGLFGDVSATSKP